MRALEEVVPSGARERFKQEKMVVMFNQRNNSPFYNGKLCMPIECVSVILQTVNDLKLRGYFKFSKTMSGSRNFRWRYKSRDMKKYIEGCFTYQQFKDSN